VSRRNDCTLEEAQRVRDCLRALWRAGATQAKLGADLGVAQQTIAAVLAGGSPGLRLALRLARKLGVYLEDLLSGAHPSEKSPVRWTPRIADPTASWRSSAAALVRAAAQRANDAAERGLTSDLEAIGDEVETGRLSVDVVARSLETRPWARPEQERIARDCAAALRAFSVCLSASGQARSSPGLTPRRRARRASLAVRCFDGGARPLSHATSREPEVHQ
jgi:DNA-binding XRE family transcriptional regulator